MGEDVEKVEGVEEEEQAKESPNPELKKRKAQKQPTVQSKDKRIAKPSPTKPTTRASTRATTKEAKEQEKKKAYEQEGPSKKKLRRKYISQPDSDEEKKKSKETSQFRVVSHTTKSDLENICDNIKNNADLTGLKSIDFNKLSIEEKNLKNQSTP